MNSFVFGTTVKFQYFWDINFWFPLGSLPVGSTEELVLGHNLGSDFSIDVFIFYFPHHSNIKEQWLSRATFIACFVYIEVLNKSKK